MIIGLVDLETSHPAGWTPIIREMGHEIRAVWDGGTVYPQGYAEEFARMHDMPYAPHTLEEIADIVDCAIIHSCNWDLHVPRARVFIERGKSVFLDKPMAGNMRDIRQIIEWSESGCRIFGGSSLRFNFEIGGLLSQPVEERGIPQIAFAGCGLDDFSYAIHSYAILWSIFGPGAESVRFLGEHGQKQAEIVWSDGRRGILTFGDAGCWIPFYATIITDKTLVQTAIDSTKVYSALLSKALPYLAGETAAPPMRMADLMEPELAAIGVMESYKQGGRPIELSKLSDTSHAYDGSAYGTEYRKQKGF